MSLPFPKKVLDQHAAVLGKTGAGKSSAMRVVVEHLLDHGKRVIVMDPKGDWWGLKARGTGEGYPVVTFGTFKGDYKADVPINEHSGKDVAELLTSGNRPAVIGLRGWFTSHMTAFWIEFAKTLFHTNEGELYLIIDEAQNFAPKGSLHGLEGKAGTGLHWTNRLLSEGRGLGINIWVGSQRPQKVHNDTLDGCETLVAMRTVHPAARGALVAWMKGAGDKAAATKILSTIGEMPRGEAWIWSPEISFGPEHVKFPMFGTFDSFAPPQLQKKVKRRSWASVDLKEVTEKFQAVIAQSKANDPSELKKQISELRRERDKLAKAPPVAAKVDKKQAIRATELAKYKKTAEEAMKIVAKIQASEFDGLSPKEIKEALQAGVDVVSKRLEAIVNTKLGEFEKFKKQANQVLLSMKKLLDSDIVVDLTVKKNEPLTFTPTSQIKPSTPSRSPVVHTEADGEEFKMTPSYQRILDSTAWWKSAGIGEPTRHQVAFVANYTVNGHFNNLVGDLKGAGLVYYPSGGGIALTTEGAAIANRPEADPTRDELISRVLGVLKGDSMRKIFRAVVDSGRDLTREELATASGYTVNGHFNNLVGSLHGIGVIEYPNKGGVRLAKLFDTLQ